MKDDLGIAKALEIMRGGKNYPVLEAVSCAATVIVPSDVKSSPSEE